MRRKSEDLRGGLQQAALESYRERGYDQTTTSEIAARAGVTERTFFRHSPDRRVASAGVAMLAAQAGMAANLTKVLRSIPSRCAGRHDVSIGSRRGSPCRNDAQISRQSSLHFCVRSAEIP